MPVQIAEAAMSPTQLAAVAAYTERLQRQMTAIEIAVIAEERAAIDKHIERHQAWLAERSADVARRDTPYRRWLANRVEAAAP